MRRGWCLVSPMWRLVTKKDMYEGSWIDEDWNLWTVWVDTEGVAWTFCHWIGNDVLPLDRQ